VVLVIIVSLKQLSSYRTFIRFPSSKKCTRVMSIWLPVSVYNYDRHSKQYLLETCVQFEVQEAPMPRVLTCGAGLGLLGDNVELLKAAMRAPAVVLRKGVRTVIYNASCEEVKTLPDDIRPIRLLRAYEFPHLNLSTSVVHYRLRPDGALVLADLGRVHCTLCYVPDHMDLDCVRSHLRSRAQAIRKLLRDRRIVVELAHRTSVLSHETLRSKNLIES